MILSAGRAIGWFPVWIGAAITVLGGLWMYWALQSRGLGFWFFCATIPFALGVIVLVIGAESRNARWLHLRIQQAPGERPQRIAFSFPLPIRLTAWFLRTFRTKIPRHGKCARRYRSNARSDG